MSKLVCHLCGFNPPDGGATFCPRDGRVLIDELEHERAPNDVWLGRVLGGRYPILGILGVGGMGAVYRSRQAGINREVAVKVVNVDLHEDTELARKRFEVEAKALARLDHPAVVEVYDFGVEKGGELYLVMERVRGLTLGDHYRRGDLTPRQIIAVVIEVLEAMDHAHKMGMIHRDLKPDNIFVLPGRRADRGRPGIKILDFGLVKIVGGSTHGQLTRTGMLAGTPFYMSPEQVTGESVDARSDVYSVAAFLFEGLAGYPPFVGDNILDILVKRVREPVPRLPDLPFVTRGVVEVVARGMAKEPDHRYATAGEMARALRALTLISEADRPMADSIGMIEEPFPEADDATSPQASQAETLAPEVPRNKLAQAREDVAGSLDSTAGRTGSTTLLGKALHRSRKGKIAAVAAAGVFGIIILALWPEARQAEEKSEIGPLMKPEAPPPVSTEEVPARLQLDPREEPGARATPGPNAPPEVSGTHATGSSPAVAKSEGLNRKGHLGAGLLGPLSKPVPAEDLPPPPLVIATAPEAPALAEASPVVCPGGMVLINGGAFTAGSHSGEEERGPSERSPRTIHLEPFCIDYYEYPNSKKKPPETGLTWYEATRRCASRGKRLCTEDEWERACKGSAGNAFAYGKQGSRTICNHVDKRGVEYKPEPAKLFPKCRSQDGVFALSGNAAEWTSSAERGSEYSRIVKGGASDKPFWTGRCAGRELVRAERKSPVIGARCCLAAGDGKRE